MIDSDNIIAIEYADKNLNVCVLQIFTKVIYTQDIVLYPAVSSEARYRCGDIILTEKEIKENGILIQNLEDNACQTLKLIKE